MAAKQPPEVKLFEPWVLPALALRDVAAIQAVAGGTASSDQQQHAMRVIVEKICRRYEMPYCPGVNGERDTVLALGRMCAGTMLTSFINTPLKNFKDPDAAPTEQG